MSDGTPVVTVFLRNRGQVLALLRAESAGTYPGRWGGVSGSVEAGEDPEETARREIGEETGLRVESDESTADTKVHRVRSGRAFTVEDDEGHFEVHPFLFDAETRGVTTNEETSEAEWLHPTDLLGRETVTDCWHAYAAVAPTVKSVAADADHGAAYISIRALEVLRDRAGLLGAEESTDETAWAELADLARRLRSARPSMAVLQTRIDRVMARAAGDNGGGSGGPPRSAAAVEHEASCAIEAAIDDDAAAAEAAAERIAGETVLTCSRSSTLLEAFERGEPSGVIVAESRPAREGVATAEALATRFPVTLTMDAAVGHVLADDDVDRVLVGADSLLPDGRVLNKTGTRTLAIVADRAGVPVDVVAASDKLRANGEYAIESGAPSALYEGPEPIDVCNPTFDVTPPDVISAIVTERGVLDPSDLNAIAAERTGNSAWR